jgi:hypothetical protein
MEEKGMSLRLSQKKVLLYFETNNSYPPISGGTIPLTFSDVNGFNSRIASYEFEINRNLRNMDTLVLSILEMTERFSSVDSSGLIVCQPMKRRSSGDIWKHILHYRTMANIFDVMASIYYMRGYLCSQYCGIVRKRVFWRRGTIESTHRGIANASITDEYGITFPTWENINVI